MAKPLSGQAALALGSLVVYLNPKMATDAKIDLSAIVRGVTAKNWKSQKPKMKIALDAALKGKMAQDADIEDVIEMLDQLDEVANEVADNGDAPSAADPVKAPAMDTDEATIAKIKEMLAGKLPDDEIASLCAMLKPAAVDAEPKAGVAPVKAPEITKAAMDAACAQAETAAVARMTATRNAERAVRPWVGEINVAMDSADEVYRYALGTMNIDLDGVHASAFPAILKAQPVPGAAPVHKPRVAMDAATSKSYDDRFPNAKRLAR
jgi:hypothetical protein